MEVPKKRTSISKKLNRKTLWKKKGYFTALKAFSLGQSIFTGNSKSFFCNKINVRIISINWIQRLFFKYKNMNIKLIENIRFSYEFRIFTFYIMIFTFYI